jgi:DNA-binding transcriptional LysR family regulator
MPFTSENVKVFLAVLDHGSFSAAARALKRVPSAISMTIAQLEAELDLVLFDRNGREPVPTSLARALEPRARLVASHLTQLKVHALELHQGVERRLSIVIAPELLTTPWSMPLMALAAEFPSMEVEILFAPQTEAMHLLRQGQVQLAVVFERTTMDEREAFQEFGSEVLVAVISPHHPMYQAREQGFTQDDLMEIRQIIVASTEVGDKDLRFILSRQLWHTDSHLAALNMVQAGLGWTHLPKTLVDPLIAAGELVAIEFEHFSNEQKLWVDVVWLKDKPLGRGAKRYIELMRQRQAQVVSASA